jgi:hypothetical protein
MERHPPKAVLRSRPSLAHLLPRANPDVELARLSAGDVDVQRNRRRRWWHSTEPSQDGSRALRDYERNGDVSPIKNREPPLRRVDYHGVRIA